MVLKYLVKECSVLIFEHDSSGRKHNENSNDWDGGGGGSIQCSLYHMDILWRQNHISLPSTSVLNGFEIITYTLTIETEQVADFCSRLTWLVT